MYVISFGFNIKTPVRKFKRNFDLKHCAFNILKL